MTYTEELSNSGEGDEEEIQDEEEVVNFQKVARVLDVGDGFEYHLPKHQLRVPPSQFGVNGRCFKGKLE